MTTGERLRGLAGVTGAAGVLLLLIGSGATAGAALVNYSQLPTGTASEHLLAERAQDGGSNARGGAGQLGDSNTNQQQRIIAHQQRRSIAAQQTMVGADRGFGIMQPLAASGAPDAGIASRMAEQARADRERSRDDEAMMIILLAAQ